MALPRFDFASSSSFELPSSEAPAFNDSGMLLAMALPRFDFIATSFELRLKYLKASSLLFGGAEPPSGALLCAVLPCGGASGSARSLPLLTYTLLASAPDNDPGSKVVLMAVSSIEQHSLSEEAVREPLGPKAPPPKDLKMERRRVLGEC